MKLSSPVNIYLSEDDPGDFRQTQEAIYDIGNKVILGNAMARAKTIQSRANRHPHKACSISIYASLGLAINKTNGLGNLASNRRFSIN